MSKYETPSGSNSEYEPGSNERVLCNSRGITEPIEAERVETELLTIAYVDSFELPISLKFTAEIICAMHHDWLADLMVLQGGYPAPEYDLDDDIKREAYYSAMRKAYNGDFKALTALFVIWIERARQLPAESRRTSR